MRQTAVAASVFVSVFATLPAFAECSLRDPLCVENQVTEGPEAATRLANYLNGPLPDGVVVTNLLEGGFQDGFIVVRLESNDPGIPRLLKLLGLTDAQFLAETEDGPAGDILNAAAEKPDWWDWKTTTDLRVAETQTPYLPYLSVGLASKPGTLDRYVIYLWGFQT